MEIGARPDAIEPTEWFVVFHPKSSNRILSWLAAGRFKHVSAVGYLPGFRAWLVCEAAWGGLHVRLYGHDAMCRMFAEYSRDCAVVKIARKTMAMRLSSRIGFYCVPAVKHLIGLRCGALRPDALLRCCLRNGGTLIDAGIHAHTLG